MIEVIDILDDPAASQYLINEGVFKEALKVIDANLFRTFTNKGNFYIPYLTRFLLVVKKSSSVDPDEDEPHLEESWPHLQLFYELLLKFVMSPMLQS